ncbi:MAG TPA: hypothetical protein VI168_03565 [Croceibacterium sp.]
MSGVGQACNLRLNGVETSAAPLDEKKLHALAKAHGSRITVEADPGTPWRCVADVIYRLQAAGFAPVYVDGAATPPN